MKYKVIKDSREKLGWMFHEDIDCEGMVVSKLECGDYSIVGQENFLTIERKGEVAEFAINVVEDRFYRELEKLNQYQFAYVILEFTISDILNYPVGSNIPKSRWPSIKIGPAFIMSSFLSMQHKYPNVKFILAGKYGKSVVSCIFKKFMKYVEKNQKTS